MFQTSHRQNTVINHQFSLFRTQFSEKVQVFFTNVTFFPGEICRNSGVWKEFPFNWPNQQVICSEVEEKIEKNSTKITKTTTFHLFSAHTHTHNVGEPYFYDPQFRGPKRERSLTDVASLIIFGIVVVIWLAIGFWGEVVGASFKQLRILLPIMTKIMSTILVPFDFRLASRFTAIGTSDFIRRVSSDTTKSTVSWHKYTKIGTAAIAVIRCAATHRRSIEKQLSTYHKWGRKWNENAHQTPLIHTSLMKSGCFRRFNTFYSLHFFPRFFVNSPWSLMDTIHRAMRRTFWSSWNSSKSWCRPCLWACC